MSDTYHSEAELARLKQERDTAYSLNGFLKKALDQALEERDKALDDRDDARDQLAAAKQGARTVDAELADALRGIENLRAACTERDWLLAEASDDLRERFFAVRAKERAS